MLQTRGVLAIIAGLLMTAALVAARMDRRIEATWVMAAGFTVASLWSIMSIFWAQNHPSPLTPKLWISVASMAVAAAVYYGYLGMAGDGLGE